jgi:hypothetical protein
VLAAHRRRQDGAVAGPDDEIVRLGDVVEALVGEVVVGDERLALLHGEPGDALADVEREVPSLPARPVRHLTRGIGP